MIPFDVHVMQVQLTLYTAGEIVADYIFDGKGSTQYSWFDKRRLTLTIKGPKLIQGIFGQGIDNMCYLLTSILFYFDLIVQLSSILSCFSVNFDDVF